MAIPRHVRFGVLERCNFSCFYCGLPAAQGVVVLQIEHVVPRALGGTDDPWNLVAACQPCNVGKTDTMPLHSLIRAASDAYMSWPKRSRAVAPCVDCRQLVVLNEDDVLAGGDPLCAKCQATWCSGYDAGFARDR